MNDSDAPLTATCPVRGTSCWVVLERHGPYIAYCGLQATVKIYGIAYCTDHGSVVLAAGIEEALERSEG